MASEISNNSTFIDPYQLSSGDNPGMSLTTTPFNGTGFLGWNRTIKMALGAKMKLGFIDGSLPKPDCSDANYQRWIRCDYMVTCWILNSMSSEISSSFVYSNSAFHLWKEIIERYGHTNGPLIYQLQRDLNEITHGDSSIVVFFNKLKKCWDELENLVDKPVCNCGKLSECSCRIEEKYSQIEEQSRLMQFLMKLNQDFESVRNQILSMDPLPSVNRAYYIVQQVERQKHLTHQIPEMTAFNVSQGVRNKPGIPGPRRFGDRRFGEEGRRYCTHCKQSGHTFDGCFERIGYPDWYKGRRNTSKGRMAANVMCEEPDTPLEFDSKLKSYEGKGRVDSDLVNAVCQEVLKVFKGKMENREGISSSMDKIVNFAGPF